MATKSNKKSASRVRPNRKQAVDSNLDGASAYDWVMAGTDRQMEDEQRARMDADADFFSAYDRQRSFLFGSSFQDIRRFPTRNSKTDPYQIDFLSAAVMGSSNLLGLGMHPGRGDRGTRIDWERDLDADLEVAWRAGVRTIVCMVEEHEFAMLRVPRYIQDVEDFGIDVIWFPVRDVSTPVSYRLMHKLCFQVWEALKTGNVLVHCRGGKGRSGTLACCYLEMMGYTYTQALQIVRSSRKGAVETRSQEQWCEEFERYMHVVRREARARDEEVGDDT